MHPLMPDLNGKNLDDLLKEINNVHKKMAWAARMGHNHMIPQMRSVADTYQEEINKRYQQEAQAAKENPIFKDSLDIG
jgi:ribosomal protein L12E/L44/L45/RPP1/RPP2